MAILLALSTGARAALPIQHWTAASGAEVYFVHAPSIPMLDVRVDIDAGSRFDPPGKEGLASLTQSMLAKGFDGLDEAAIAERFADVAARRGGGVGDDRASVSVRTLSSPREREIAIDLLARMLSGPLFPAAVLEREKERLTQALREAAVRPQVIAARAFSRALFGDHPYGRSALPESVGRISRDDVVGFHRIHYGARRAVVSIVGAIGRDEAALIAERLGAALPAGEPTPEPPPPVRSVAVGRELRIAHPASQSHILIGDVAIRRADPDYLALFLGNHILGGGGFTSRLTTEVREKRGLAYSVYSYFAPGLQPGAFTIGLQTKKEQTDEALAVVRETLAAFLRDGPTEAELRAAKDNLIGGFALRIDSNADILGQLSRIGVFGLGTDYLERWTERIEQLSVAQVHDAFRRHVDMSRLHTVVVGAGTDPGR